MLSTNGLRLVKSGMVQRGDVLDWEDGHIEMAFGLIGSSVETYADTFKVYRKPLEPEELATTASNTQSATCHHQHTHIESLTSGSICDDCGEQL